MRGKTAQYLTTGKLSRIFPQYLFPSVAATLLISANYFVDTICVGQKFGEIGLAALNVVVPVTGFLYALGYLFAYGGSIQYAALLGEGNDRGARAVYTGSLLTLVAASLILSAVGLVFLDPITAFLSGGGSIADTSKEYLRFVFWFGPFYSLEIYYSVFMRNDGMPRRSMWGTISGCSLNIVLDILFIFVFEWGMRGASLATGLAIVAATLVEMSGLLRKGSNLRFERVRGYAAQLWHTVRVGAPTFMRELAASLVILIINILLLRLSGELAVAAYGVVANLGTVVMCGLAGVSNAMQPLVSVNAGAERQDRVRTLLRMALVWSAAFSVVYLVFAEIWPQLLTAVFVDSDDAAFLSMSMTGIRLASVGYVLGGLTIVLNVYFESVQANGQAFLLSMARGMAFPVVCAVVGAWLWGVTGVWISLPMAEALSLILAVVMSRFVGKGIRQHRYIHPRDADKEVVNGLDNDDPPDVRG